MKALVGYALLFIAIGIIIAYFVEGFCEFLLVLVMLFVSYVLLCKC